jgi:hypothetical protein
MISYAPPSNADNHIGEPFIRHLNDAIIQHLKSFNYYLSGSENPLVSPIDYASLSWCLVWPSTKSPPKEHLISSEKVLPSPKDFGLHTLKKLPFGAGGTRPKMGDKPVIMLSEISNF